VLKRADTIPFQDTKVWFFELFPAGLVRSTEYPDNDLRPRVAPVCKPNRPQNRSFNLLIINILTYIKRRAGITGYSEFEPSQPSYC
jgi:hypothetical protein